MLVKNSYNLKFIVNGTDLLTVPGIQISSLDIYEDIYDGLPTFSAELAIPKSALDADMFVDGSTFEIMIDSDTFEIKGDYIFRCWDIPQITQTDNYNLISLNGILDVYEIYRDGNKFNLYSNTSDIFKNIAEENNLTSDIDATKDLQLWVAGRRNLFQFMHHLCKYGYCDETSAMIFFFDKEKRLIYKDFSKLLKNKTKEIYTFVKSTVGNSKKRTFGYNDGSISLYAGTDNVVNGGYGNDFEVFNLLTYQPNTIRATKVVAESETINISKELSQGLNYDWFPFDIGNFYDKYWIAYAQNKRIRSTYSTYIKLNCQNLQKFRLGEVVNVDFRDTSAENNKSKNFSLLGIIGSIHTTITTDNISAEVEVVSQGINTKSKTVMNF